MAEKTKPAYRSGALGWLLFAGAVSALLTWIAFHAEPLQELPSLSARLAVWFALTCLIVGELLCCKRFPRLRPYVYLQPMLILLIVFCYIPPVEAFIRAFYRWKQSGAAEFIGLDNFRYMLYDLELRQSFVNLGILAFFQVVLGVTIPLAVAELLYSIKSARACYWYRLLLLVPMVVPAVVIFLIWEYLMDYDVGLFNRVLVNLGLDPLGWFKDPRMALYCFVLMGFPWVSGISVLIYLAGLYAIGDDVMESCQIEGASTWQRFIYVDLPMLRGQIKLVSVLSVIGVMNGWVAQWVITKGGPGNATLVPALHMFLQAMRFDYMGYACAVGLVLFILTLGVTYANMKLLKAEV